MILAYEFLFHIWGRRWYNCSRSGEHLGAALHGIGEKLFFFIIDVPQWRDALTASQSYVGSAARVSESCEHKGWMRTRIMRMIKDEKHTKGNETRKKRGIRRTPKRNVTINAKCEQNYVSILFAGSQSHHLVIRVPNRLS